MKMAEMEDDEIGVDVVNGDEPDWVTEGTSEDQEFVVESEDISKAEQMEPMADVIEPAKGVEFRIEKIDTDSYVPEGQIAWRTRSIKPWLVIGPKGVDGKGRYAGKYFFPRILVAVNRDAYDFTVNVEGNPTKWYNSDGGAWGDYSAFLTALGFNAAK